MNKKSKNTLPKQFQDRETKQKKGVSEDTFTVSPWPSCSAASAICSFFLEACPLTLGDNIMQNEA